MFLRHGSAAVQVQQRGLESSKPQLDCSSEQLKHTGKAYLSHKLWKRLKLRFLGEPLLVSYLEGDRVCVQVCSAWVQSSSSLSDVHFSPLAFQRCPIGAGEYAHNQEGLTLSTVSMRQIEPCRRVVILVTPTDPSHATGLQELQTCITSAIRGAVLWEGSSLAIPIYKATHICEVKEAAPAKLVKVGATTTVDIRLSAVSPLMHPLLTHNDSSHTKEESNSLSCGVVEQLYQLLLSPMRRSQLFQQLHINPPTGVLLVGPPGVGKTFAVKQVSARLALNLFEVDGPAILSGPIGYPEATLRTVFSEARVHAATSSQARSLIFIDEIDVLCPRRDHSTGSSSRVVAQLLTLMDGLSSSSSSSDSHNNLSNRVVVVGASNRANSIDPALRRPGRFDREMVFEPPQPTERLQILRSFLPGERLASDVSLQTISDQAIGYVASDLEALCREASMKATKRQAPNQQAVITQSDLAYGLRVVGSSSARGVQLRTPPVDFDSIGGLSRVKQAIRLAIEWPLLYPEAFARMGVRQARGVLLCGPPGCAKTMLVRALASTLKCGFFSLNGAQVYNAYLGEAERTVRELFAKARANSPSIVLLDEVDALVTRRELGNASSGGMEERILSTLLNEMDGISSSGGCLAGVVVVACTNRPNSLDEALLRPGRFDKVLFVTNPQYQFLRYLPRTKKPDSPFYIFTASGCLFEKTCHWKI